MKPSEQHKRDLERADQEYEKHKLEADNAKRADKFRLTIEATRGKNINPESLIFEGRMSFWVGAFSLVSLTLVIILRLGDTLEYLSRWIGGGEFDVIVMLPVVCILLGLVAGSVWSSNSQKMIELGKTMKAEQNEQ